MEVEFDQGELLHNEVSCKFRRETISEQLHGSVVGQRTNLLLVGTVRGRSLEQAYHGSVAAPVVTKLIETIFQFIRTIH